ncbi:hypothetical protein FKP32DRAFT_1673965 [Trametes sanguinea]|nr:hypothetical protein FKP32DRAFT_1673965 [Trametes sanguinea]
MGRPLYRLRLPLDEDEERENQAPPPYVPPRPPTPYVERGRSVSRSPTPSSRASSLSAVAPGDRELIDRSDNPAIASLTSALLTNPRPVIEAAPERSPAQHLLVQYRHAYLQHRELVSIRRSLADAEVGMNETRSQLDLAFEVLHNQSEELLEQSQILRDQAHILHEEAMRIYEAGRSAEVARSITERQRAHVTRLANRTRNHRQGIISVFNYPIFQSHIIPALEPVIRDSMAPLSELPAAARRIPGEERVSGLYRPRDHEHIRAGARRRREPEAEERRTRRRLSEQYDADDEDAGTGGPLGELQYPDEGSS